MTRHLLMAATAAACLAASGAAAQDRFAVGGQVGTTGVGLEAKFKLTDRLAVRGALDTLKFDHQVDSDDISYDGEFDFNTAGLFLDYHPTGGAFFITGGAYFGERRIQVEGSPQGGSVVIGGQTFTAAETGTLTGEVDFGDSAPFVGLGWDGAFNSDRRVNFKVLAGAAFGGDPQASLARTGGVTLPPVLQTQLDQALAREEQDLEDEVDFSLYPVVQVGVSYRF